MRRFSSFRDFDWMLLTLVLLISVISVLEIKSATLNTKFHGFGEKQIGFLLVGLLLMFLISFVDYHRLVDFAPWAYGVSLLALIAPDPGAAHLRHQRAGDQVRDPDHQVPRLRREADRLSSGRPASRRS